MVCDGTEGNIKFESFFMDLENAKRWSPGSRIPKYIWYWGQKLLPEIYCVLMQVVFNMMCSFSHHKASHYTVICPQLFLSHKTHFSDAQLRGWVGTGGKLVGAPLATTLIKSSLAARNKFIKNSRTNSNFCQRRLFEREHSVDWFKVSLSRRREGGKGSNYGQTLTRE